MRQTRLLKSSVGLFVPKDQPKTSFEEKKEKESQLRVQLFQSVEEDDVTKCKQTCMKIHAEGLTLGDEGMRNSESKATALHRALDGGHCKVAKFLIEYGNPVFLMEECDSTLQSPSSKLTCLHIIADKGFLELGKILMDRIKGHSRKIEYMSRFTIREPMGDSPKKLAALHIAAMHGHLELIEMLVDHGLSVNFRAANNDTALSWAVRGGHNKTVKRLIQLGADVSISDDRGSAPLHWALRNCSTDIVEILLIDGRANVHQERKFGLMSPIVLAAALGLIDIMKLLLKHGADVNVRVANNQTPLQLAVKHNHIDAVQLLLDSGATVDDEDDYGNTALIIATREGHEEIAEMLIEHTANVDAKNKDGENIWSHIIEKHDIKFLKTLARLYSEVKELGEHNLSFPPGPTPLHIAAMQGEVEKLRELIRLGADPTSRDQNGNTFYHLAARHNKAEVLTAFMNRVDVNSKNNDGDTPLHLAAYDGHEEAVSALLKKAKLNVVNSNGFTPLHSAAASGTSSPVVIRRLMETMVKHNSWNLMNALSTKGNTALHVAAHGDRAEFIPDLSHLNPSVLNDAMDSAMHVAAKARNSEVLTALLNVFNKPSYGFDIDLQNGEGETLLHICAKAGNAGMVEPLIAAGADLVKKNEQGNTILHELAEQMILEPTQTERLLDVYQAIVRCTTLWWCLRHDIPYPDEGSDVYKETRRTALVYITSQVYNKKGSSVMTYSSLIGALPLLKAILETRNCYKKRIPKAYEFDVTNLTPDTIARKDKVVVRHNSRYSLANSSEQSFDLCQDDDGPSGKSCLELIAYLSDEVLATQFLDIVPLRQLVQNLWGRYQWIYVVLMVLHLVYMGCFTSFALPVISHAYGTANITHHADDAAPSKVPLFFFLTWPLLLVGFEIFYLVSKVVRYKRKYESSDIDDFRITVDYDEGFCTKFSIVALPAIAMRWVFEYLSHIATFCFCACMVSWVILCLMNSSNQIIPLSLAMVVGWMFTIVFTRGFESVHAFSIMLSYIIVRDITRFLLIYAFVMFAFGLALHVCFLVSPAMAEEHPTAADSVFMTFDLMIGMGEIFGDDFDEVYGGDGGPVWFVKLLYVMYMILGTVILLNLLIAMLSDTYNDIKSKEGTTWRVGSVRLALTIEQTMPWVRRMITKMGLLTQTIKYDKETGRWKMILPMELVQGEGEHEVSEVMRSIQKLDRRLDRLQTAYLDLTTQLESNKPKEAAGPSTEPSEAVRSAKGKLRGATKTLIEFRRRAAARKHDGISEDEPAFL